MSTINVDFSSIKTNLVECVFSFKQSFRADPTTYSDYDEYGHSPSALKLKRYTYRVPKELSDNICVGDAVLVYCKTGYQLVEVVSRNVTSNFEESSFAPVVCKIDLSSFVSEIEKQKKLEYMKKKLVEEKKKLEAMITYELIAEKNPEFKKMLDAFKDMGGEL